MLNYRLGEPFTISSQEYRSRFLDVLQAVRPGPDSVCCLGAWFASCATSTGAALPGVPGTDQGRLNSVEKLRGTDFCIGEIGCYTTGDEGFWAPYGDVKLVLAVLLQLVQAKQYLSPDDCCRFSDC